MSSNLQRLLFFGFANTLQRQIFRQKDYGGFPLLYFMYDVKTFTS